MATPRRTRPIGPSMLKTLSPSSASVTTTPYTHPTKPAGGDWTSLVREHPNRPPDWRHPRPAARTVRRHVTIVGVLVTPARGQRNSWGLYRSESLHWGESPARSPPRLLANTNETHLHIGLYWSLPCLAAPLPIERTWSHPRKIFDAYCTISYVLNSRVTRTNLTKYLQDVRKWLQITLLKSNYDLSVSFETPRWRIKIFVK